MNRTVLHARERTDLTQLIFKTSRCECSTNDCDTEEKCVRETEHRQILRKEGNASEITS